MPFTAVRALRWMLIGATMLDVAVAPGAEFDAGLIVRGAVETVEQSALGRPKVDDRISRAWFTAFFKTLDPRRMYFLAADIEEFRSYENRLDDLARDGDFEFAAAVRSRYSQRVRESLRHAEAYVDGFHDDSIDEEVEKRYERYATTADELRERWRRRIKLELLIERVYGRREADVRDQLAARYARIARQAGEMSDERLGEIYLNALLATIDPHAAYRTPTFEASAPSGLMRTYHTGLRFEPRDGRILWRAESRRPLELDLLRLRSLELIAIRHIDGPTHDVVEMPIEEISRMIRSPSKPFDDERELILELLDVDTCERLAVKCRRVTQRERQVGLRAE